METTEQCKALEAKIYENAENFLVFSRAYVNDAVANEDVELLRLFLTHRRTDYSRCSSCGAFHCNSHGVCDACYYAETFHGVCCCICGGPAEFVGMWTTNNDGETVPAEAFCRDCYYMLET